MVSDSEPRYEDRYVAFVDVLGWGNFVCQATSDPVLLGKLLRAVTGMPKGMPYDENYPHNPRFTQFSDSLVISAYADLEGRHHLQQRLWMMWNGLMSLGLFMRGGVARGMLYHKDGIAIGPALVDAYEIERDKAVYPRIVLAKGLHDWGRKDEGDNEFFFDLLRYYHKVDVPDHFPEYEGFYQVPAFDPAVREAIARAFRQHSNPTNSQERAVFEKYEWQVKYFNAVADEINLAMCEPFALRQKPPIEHIEI